jgi:hypothetical protein
MSSDGRLFFVGVMRALLPPVEPLLVLVSVHSVASMPA